MRSRRASSVVDPLAVSRDRKFRAAVSEGEGERAPFFPRVSRRGCLRFHITKSRSLFLLGFTCKSIPKLAHGRTVRPLLSLSLSLSSSSRSKHAIVLRRSLLVFYLTFVMPLPTGSYIGSGSTFATDALLPPDAQHRAFDGSPRG